MSTKWWRHLPPVGGGVVIGAAKKRKQRFNDGQQFFLKQCTLKGNQDTVKSLLFNPLNFLNPFPFS